ncbi:helix-turn-helix domain-containing protein [Bacillus sp. RG28]|uniref:Helix-turn-helix domain-containing protein n=1 Tax=Gottfriedia endophytica TaxID=2820819 RepID=A0A940SKX4_9BACI|nr:helix-turn-helix domain-containing protein [Gottfriedia endophytica]MBP0726901.1 helix-turn-helix domain-containing protein [Gottfriedia endophytica]
MIDNLNRLFGNENVILSNSTMKSDDYFWFTIDSYQTPVGIKKEVITNDQLNLLYALFPNAVLFEHKHGAHQQWYNYLILKNAKNPFTEEKIPIPQSIRFIQFNIKQKTIDYAAFEETITAFFNNEVAIIWCKANQGFILEKIQTESYDNKYINYVQETLAADLFYDITFFIGKLHHPQSNLQQFFSFEQNCFQYALRNKKHKNILLLTNEILPYFLSLLPQEMTEILPDLILSEFNLDDPILETVKFFLQNNQNITATAKQSYLHRNTVQYRVDKFTERTGIDLKDFQSSYIAFLAIYLLEKVTVPNN